MVLIDLLREKQAAVVKRWQDKTLGTYAPDAKAFLKREKNQFANPVGHSILTGTEAIYGILLAGMDPEKLCQSLDEIIKIRAIQDFTPSQALRFVFHLKESIHEELAKELRDDKLLREWVEFEPHIDQIALFAFDIYTRCRDKVYELRVNEVKRRVSKVLDRINRFAPDEDGEQDAVEPQSQ